MSLAKRRHHRQRMIDKAGEILFYIHGYPAELAKARKRKYADNLAVCSCDGCCNIRRSSYREKGGLTRQELLNKLDFDNYTRGNKDG